MKVKLKTGSGTAVSWQRYAWIGAALGLYFGLFFRPLREPSLMLVVGLSLLAALVTLIVRMVKAKQVGLDGRALRQFAILWAQYALFLAMLEGRHLAYAWGGKGGATLFAAIMGAITGLWYGYTQKQGQR
ncbi:MAG: hypothetical protein IAE79_26665 [Anaerolinea sp.]|nr:hypothetical protein [Anaerolinea sp.]